MEYIFGTESGLFFGTFELKKTSKGKNYEFSENKNEYYFKGIGISCFVEPKPNIIFVSKFQHDDISVVDRTKNSVIKEINITSAIFGCSLQKILGYDSRKYPFLLFKDEEAIYLINTVNYDWEILVKSTYTNRSGYPSCLY